MHGKALKLSDERKAFLEAAILRYREVTSTNDEIIELGRKYEALEKLGRRFVEALKGTSTNEEIIEDLELLGNSDICHDPIGMLEDIVDALSGRAKAFANPSLNAEFVVGRPLRSADAPQAELVHSALVSWRRDGHRVSCSTDPVTGRIHGPCVEYLKIILDCAMGDQRPADATLKNWIRNFRLPREDEAVRSKVRKLVER